MCRNQPRALPLAFALAGLLAFVNTHAQDDPVQTFVRGDVISDGTTDALDVFESLGYLFAGREAAVDCDKAFDVNDDGRLDVADPISLLTFAFLDGDAPPAPFPICAIDLTDDELSCNEYGECPVITPTDIDEAAHVLRRIAYGQTPELLDRVLTIGSRNYIAEQLEPEGIDEAGNELLNDLIGEIEPDRRFKDLIRLQVIRAVHSERQLVEVMTDFWENHFSTYLHKVYTYFEELQFMDGPVYNTVDSFEITTYLEWLENEAFRADALGDFHDLLETSATSVTMLIYLDNISNETGNPNENYARELLELHTMGVDNGYTQLDIEELARVFTGWGICTVDPDDVDDPAATCESLDDVSGNVWAFHFDPLLHDDEEKTIFEGTSHEITLGDDEDEIDEGFAFLEHVAGLAQTAEFVCRKLIAMFVSDDGSPALLADCITAWDDTGGDIGEVVETILTSDEFFDTGNHLGKVRTPREFFFATIRAFGGTLQADMDRILTAMERMPHNPFHFETPDGYPESGVDLLGTQKLRSLIDFTNVIEEDDDDVDFERAVEIMEAHDVSLQDADSIATFWLERLFGTLHDDDDKQLAVDYLETDEDGAEVALDVDADDYERRILNLLAFIANYPQHREQ